MRLAAAVPAALALLLPAVVPARRADAPPSWLGVTFEQPAAALRASLGDPVRLLAFPDAMGADAPPGLAPERKARYTLSITPPLFLIVSERRGVVVGIEAFAPQTPSAEVAAVAPDPSGIRLGSTEAQVRAAHPKATTQDDEGSPLLVDALGPRYFVEYRLDRGRVVAIIWSAHASTDTATGGAPLGEPAGDGPGTAILEVQKNEDDGVRWQRMWEYFHPCDRSTQWRRTSVATVNQGGRVYDVATLQCPTTNATRKVYFDITSFFGKL